MAFAQRDCLTLLIETITSPAAAQRPRSAAQLDYLRPTGIPAAAAFGFAYPISDARSKGSVSVSLNGTITVPAAVLLGRSPSHTRSDHIRLAGNPTADFEFNLPVNH
jgi:hypothetical protein